MSGIAHWFQWNNETISGGMVREVTCETLLSEVQMWLLRDGNEEARMNRAEQDTTERGE